MFNTQTQVDLGCEPPAVHFIVLHFRRLAIADDLSLFESNSHIEVRVGMVDESLGDIEDNSYAGSTGTDVGRLVNFPVSKASLCTPITLYK